MEQKVFPVKKFETHGTYGNRRVMGLLLSGPPTTT